MPRYVSPRHTSDAKPHTETDPVGCACGTVSLIHKECTSDAKLHPETDPAGCAFGNVRLHVLLCIKRPSINNCHSDRGPSLSLSVCLLLFSSFSILSLSFTLFPFSISLCLCLSFSCLSLFVAVSLSICVPLIFLLCLRLFHTTFSLTFSLSLLCYPVSLFSLSHMLVPGPSPSPIFSTSTGPNVFFLPPSPADCNCRISRIFRTLWPTRLGLRRLPLF